MTKPSSTKPSSKTNEGSEGRERSENRGRGKGRRGKSKGGSEGRRSESRAGSEDGRSENRGRSESRQRENKKKAKSEEHHSSEATAEKKDTVLVDSQGNRVIFDCQVDGGVVGYYQDENAPIYIQDMLSSDDDYPDDDMEMNRDQEERYQLWQQWNNRYYQWRNHASRCRHMDHRRLLLEQNMRKRRGDPEWWWGLSRTNAYYWSKSVELGCPGSVHVVNGYLDRTYNRSR